jgi:hypothetical protein
VGWVWGRFDVLFSISEFNFFVLIDFVSLACLYIYIYSINLVSFKVTLRSSGTDILYGCHLLLDVCIIYFISCDCIVNNSSLSYPIY